MSSPIPFNETPAVSDQEAAEEILREAYNSEVAGDIEHAMDMYQASMYM